MPWARKNGTVEQAPIVVVMGVTGAGKTTVGRLVAQGLGVPFVDADDHHTDGAKAKMRAGVSLTDDDRNPWLDRLNHVLQEHEASGMVLACSALTASYRERLVRGLDRVRFVLLTGDPRLIARRAGRRRGHFARAELLPSQLATLEPPEDALTLDVDDEPAVIASRALAALR